MFPLSAVAKTLCSQASQTLMRTTGLGISAAGETLITQATQALMRTTGLGFSAFMETIFDDADAAAVRTTISAGVGYTFSAKSADFSAADGVSYDVDSSGAAVIPTLPAAGAGKKVRVKLKTAGNNCTVTRAGADTIDGATTYVMSVAGEGYAFEVDNTGTNWAIFG